MSNTTSDAVQSGARPWASRINGHDRDEEHRRVRPLELSRSPSGCARRQVTRTAARPARATRVASPSSRWAGCCACSCRVSCRCSRSAC